MVSNRCKQYGNEMQSPRDRDGQWHTPRWRAIGMLLATALAPLSGVAQAPRNVDSDRLAVIAALEQAVVEAIARAEPSVVAISRTSRADAVVIGDAFGDLRPIRDAESTPTTVAAGVIIDPAGLVLTQYLAVREGEQHAITTTDGNTYSATIRAADPRSGLAVLAIERTAGPPRRTGNSTPNVPVQPTFPAIQFGDAEKLRKGQFVVALGNPFAIESDGQPTASWGIVTNLARKAPADANLNDAPGPSGDYRTTVHHLGTLVQTDAKLGWSAGGGALVNLQGELVGVTTTLATIAGHEQPAGYAIPINITFRRIIETLKQGREVEYGMLGISFGIGETGAERAGVTVGDVIPGSPASRAGLQTGDSIVRVGDQPADDVEAIQLAVSMQPPATVTTIEYQRVGRSATTEVTLAKLAVAGKTIATVRPEAWRGIRVDYPTAVDTTALMQAVDSGAYDPQGCVLVRQVEPQSEAWQTGVREGMFISHVGDRRVSTPAEFFAAANELGDKLDIRLTRPVSEKANDSEAAERDLPTKPSPP